jgi:hypothetical protein
MIYINTTRALPGEIDRDVLDQIIQVKSRFFGKPVEVGILLTRSQNDILIYEPYGPAPQKVPKARLTLMFGCPVQIMEDRL